MIKILFLSANPEGTTRLRLAQEHRSIKEEVARTPYGRSYIIEAAFAVRVRDLQGALQDHRPKIVHFAGHGRGSGQTAGAREFAPEESNREPHPQHDTGIVVEDDAGYAVSIPVEALAELFRLAGCVECVVLSACHTQVQADAIRRHVDMVIGMAEAINDASAIAFSEGFYRALAKCHSVEQSFEYGKNEIALRKLPDAGVPILHSRAGIDPVKRYFIPSIPGVSPAIMQPPAEAFSVQPRPIEVLRVRIEEDPDKPGALSIRHAQFLEPRIAGQEQRLPILPHSFEGVHVVFGAIVHILGALRHAYPKLQTSRLVLQLEVPLHLACAAFEASKRQLTPVPLGRMFRCVVIKPLSDERIRGTLRDAIKYPGREDNAVALWEPLDAETLYETIQDKSCYFAGPALWNTSAVTENSVAPPAVASFDTAACAILTDVPDRVDFLNELFAGADALDIGKLFDAVTRLRKARVRIVVLWDDVDYDPLPAHSI